MERAELLKILEDLYDSCKRQCAFCNDGQSQGRKIHNWMIGSSKRLDFCDDPEHITLAREVYNLAFPSGSICTVPSNTLKTPVLIPRSNGSRQLCRINQMYVFVQSPTVVLTFDVVWTEEGKDLTKRVSYETLCALNPTFENRDEFIAKSDEARQWAHSFFDKCLEESLQTWPVKRVYERVKPACRQVLCSDE